MSDPEARRAARTQLEQELLRLRGERRDLAADLTGEDPENTHGNDVSVASDSVDDGADLAARDGRIRELEERIAALDPPQRRGELADGTVVTLRFPDGDQATMRVVTIAERADSADTLTSDSPLGRALVGHGAGDTVTYLGPDGELRAEVVELR